MMWQDLIFTLGGIAFSIALIPSVISRDAKPALTTCALTAFWLSLFAVAFASLHYYWAGTMQAITAFLWWVLLFQKGQQHPNFKEKIAADEISKTECRTRVQQVDMILHQQEIR